MTAHGTTASLALLLALSASQAMAGVRPLQLGLAAPLPARFAPSPPLRVTANQQRFENGPGFLRPGRVEQAGQGAPNLRLRERAVQSVLDAPEPAFGEDPGAGRLQLHFHKPGSAIRDLNKSYREMCNRVSARIWSEPNGKRVRFDVAGKPGVGFEIPIH